MNKLISGMIFISINRIVYAIMAIRFNGILFWNDYLYVYKTWIIELFGWILIIWFVIELLNHKKLNKKSKNGVDL